MSSVTRTFDLLDRLQQNFDKEVCLAGKSSGKWVEYSTKEYIDSANCVSAALLELGFEKGDKIVTVSNNRPEWNILDMGMAQVGVVHVPLYPNLSTDEYKYLINHSEAKGVFVGNRLIYNRVSVAVEEGSLDHFYTIDVIEDEHCLAELIEHGKKSLEAQNDEINKIKESIDTSDLMTIIYTSGTTGTAKGVMLSHRAMITNAISTSTAHHLTHEDGRVLSFLPLSHVYERMMNYHYQYKGMPVFYAQNMGTVLADLNYTKANIFTSVPRFLEKVYDGIVAKGKDLPFLQKKLFFWAVNLGLSYDVSKEKSPLYRSKLSIARKLIFSKWLAAMGGEVKVIISGGAALQERLARVFSAIGISVQEGYGLSETGPVIAVNFSEQDRRMMGTVGPILENIDVKFGEDGEILCKGPNLMEGYYKDPEYTKEVIDEDGYFHTGDIGVLLEGKYLKITDRKKSIFKLSAGKYVAPQVIENYLKESDFIEQTIVLGENQKHAAALISPNFNYLHFWAAKHKIVYRDNAELISNIEVKKRIQREVNGINSRLSPHEHVKRMKIVADEWSTATGELSATLKVKREVVVKQYSTEINQLF